jgi:hypothetical protein
MEDLSSMMKDNNDIDNVSKNGNAKAVSWRRAKVLELTSQGNSQVEIARVLCVGEATISRDLSYLRQQANENLKVHIQGKLPEEYQNCMTGINQVLKICWEIVNKSRSVDSISNDNDSQTVSSTMDSKTVLQALALINDCNKYKMDLTTNGVVITDAIKFVQTNKEKLTMSEKDNNGKESKEPDYDEDKEHDHPTKKQEEETGELGEEEDKKTTKTTNQVF